MAQDGAKMAPRWPQDGPKTAPRRPKMAPKRPKMAQDRPLKRRFRLELVQKNDLWGSEDDLLLKIQENACEDGEDRVKILEDAQML